MPELRNYEAAAIFNAQLPDDAIEALVEKLQKVLVDGGATMKEVSRWGRRRLAYSINKQDQGYYIIFYFTMESGWTEMLEIFERTCRYDENIWRHMVVRVPFKKRGKEVVQQVPQPGHLAEWRFENREPLRRPRPADFRRRPDRDARPSDQAAAPAAPNANAEAAPAAPAPAEAAPVKTEEPKPAE